MQTVYIVVQTSLPDQWIANVVQTHSGMLLSLQKGWHAIYTITQVILKDILSKASQTPDVYWISLIIGST